MSRKGFHSRDLWGLKGGRRGSLLRPDAPELQDGKIRKWGTKSMRFPGREASRDFRVRMEGRGGHAPAKGAGVLPPGAQPKYLPPCPCCGLLTWLCPCPSLRRETEAERGSTLACRAGGLAFRFRPFPPPKFTPFSSTHRLREPQWLQIR